MMTALAAALALTAAQPVAVTSTRIPYRPPPPACTHQPSPAGTDLMLLGVYQGETLSTAWVGDPDEDTAVVYFRVEPGRPVHLIIGNYAQNIYRFSGATSRIRRLTIMAHHPSAVAGLPAGRVEFAAACLSYGLYDAEGGGEAAVRRRFGRAPASILQEYSPFTIHVGRGLRHEPFRRTIWGDSDPETNQFNHFTPSGIDVVDPRELVAAAPTGRYITLPQEAGIRQLFRAGALVRATEGDARAWRERAGRGPSDPRTRVGPSYGAYRVTRPITVPSGLCGAHSVSFYAPSPDYIRGDPCHSDVYFDDGTQRRPG